MWASDIFKADGVIIVQRRRCQIKDYWWRVLVLFTFKDYKKSTTNMDRVYMVEIATAVKAVKEIEKREDDLG